MIRSKQCGSKLVIKTTLDINKLRCAIRLCFEPKAQTRMENHDWQLSLALDWAGGDSAPLSSITWAQTGSHRYHQCRLEISQWGCVSSFLNSPNQLDNGPDGQQKTYTSYKLKSCLLDLKCPYSPQACWMPIGKQKCPTIATRSFNYRWQQRWKIDLIVTSCLLLESAKKVGTQGRWK